MPFPLAEILGGGLVNGVVNLLKGIGILKDPEAEAKVTAALLDYEAKLESHFSDRMKAVNETMRAEAQSGSWMQRSWRPMIGFSSAAMIINNYILLPYAKALGLTIETIQFPPEIWMFMAAVLGVAAWTRGQEKIARIAANGK